MTIQLAEPFPYTSLSLDRYARIMGLAPMQFASAIAFNTAGEYIYQGTGQCDDIWWDYDWQDNDKISRYSLAEAIYETEQDIARFIGYPVAPIWIEEEVQMYPRHHRRDVWGSGHDVRLKHKSLHLNSKRIIAPGQRAITLVSDSLAVTYEDRDSDGFFETAVVSVATTQTDPRIIKVYFEDTTAAQAWEIRPARSKAISAGVFTAVFWSWQMIHPDTRQDLPVDGDGLGAIDISGNPPDNTVTAVDVYAEYNDSQLTEAQFVWTASPDWNSFTECMTCGGSGCVACGLTTQNGCFDISDPLTGLVTPWPAAYDTTDERWEPSTFSVCREPDYVKFWYYAGAIEQTYLKEQAEAVWLPTWLARVITYMATARLEKIPCTCGNAVHLARKLMTDMMMPDANQFFNININILDNPFGTRWGEVYAYNKLKTLAPRSLGGGVV